MSSPKLIGAFASAEHDEGTRDQMEAARDKREKLRPLTRAHLEAEIGRLRIGASDMAHALAGAAHIAAMRAGTVARMNGDAEEALATGVIVSYARPFMPRQGIGPLDQDEWAPSDSFQARFHRALITLRNKRYAHTDRTELRGVEDVFGSGVYSEWSVGFTDDAWQMIGELAEAQARRMRELASRLEDALRTLSEGQA